MFTRKASNRLKASKLSPMKKPDAFTGLVDLAGQQYFSLEGVHIPTQAKVLDVSFNKISDFSGMHLRNGIHKIIADKTPLTSLKGLKNAPNCHAISLVSTPVSQNKHYKLSLVILFGDSLVSIDGKSVNKSLQEKAKKYPPYAKDLINQGWMAEYPVPNEERFEELGKQYNIDIESYNKVEEEEEEEEEIKEIKPVKQVKGSSPSKTVNYSPASNTKRKSLLRTKKSSPSKTTKSKLLMPHEVEFQIDKNMIGFVQTFDDERLKSLRFYFEKICSIAEGAENYVVDDDGNQIDPSESRANNENGIDLDDQNYYLHNEKEMDDETFENELVSMLDKYGYEINKEANQEAKEDEIVETVDKILTQVDESNINDDSSLSSDEVKAVEAEVQKYEKED